MKLSLNWLKEFVPIDCSPQELAHRLTMAGLEVEQMETFGDFPDSVLVVQIEKMEKHPDADRLTLCEVRVTQDRVEQIVCGAKNMKVGDKVPLAQPGTILPGNFKIQKSKIRGVVSNGMLCSEKELGLAADAQGLMILPCDLPIGKPLKEALPLQDTLFEINVTPNRGDCLSVLGIAREVAALFNLPLKLPASHLPEPTLSFSKKIEVENSQACPRYLARSIQGVRVSASPVEVQLRLQRMGVRSINNIVDATNYVLLELGHPTHAFDAAKLMGESIRIQRAQPSSKMKALDEVEYILESSDLTIQDAQYPIAIAGVMGGFETGVNDQTQNLILETACFDPSTVRKTSKRLALQSESSYRFERGVDINSLKFAADRLAHLILTWAGGSISQIFDTAPQKISSNKVVLRKKRLEQVLGIVFESSGCLALLKRLHLEGESTSEETFEVQIPSYRRDLEREIDLIEEIARLKGYEAIPPVLPEMKVRVAVDYDQDSREKMIRDLLTHHGFSETIHYSFTSEKELKFAGMSTQALLQLMNPLSEEMAVMRPSLIPQLLRCIQKNHAFQNSHLKLFEIRTVYHQNEEGILCESKKLAFILSGMKSDRQWFDKSQAVDFFDAKAVIESLFQALHLSFNLKPSSVSWLHPGMSADLSINNQTLGSFGKLHPQIAEAFDLSLPVVLGEIDLNQLLRVPVA
ncbi:MAG: phenylalanine--tRNA ligase subunit beta, partial [Deltaproteobacteria bacterium]|nr:phenylalanine--tRNA ligase subunit beta [Deltaproteobacteria bacterium]